MMGETGPGFELMARHAARHVVVYRMARWDYRPQHRETVYSATVMRRYCRRMPGRTRGRRKRPRNMKPPAIRFWLFDAAEVGSYDCRVVVMLGAEGARRLGALKIFRRRRLAITRPGPSSAAPRRRVTTFPMPADMMSDIRR